MVDILFPALGGLGLFLTGMKLLADGLIAVAGAALRRALIRFTGTPFKAFLSGTLATALVQSSSATTVTLIGFVSAGLITFSQAIGVVIGASLGNTATGWIVAGLGLKISLGFYTLPLIGIGALLKLLGRGRATDLGLALSGFGLIFLGLDTLQQGMQGLAQHYSMANLPHGGIGAYFLVMLVGLIMTTIMQSSTAAIATTLAAYHATAISFDQAAALVVGAAIGTTITGALVTIGGTTAAKRTALAHILFNLVAGVIAIVLLPVLIHAVDYLNQYAGLSPGALSLAAFHTLFIGIGVAVVLPFTGAFANVLTRLLPERGEPLVSHLDDSLLALEPVALEAAQRALHAINHQLFDAFRQVLASGYSPVVNSTIVEIRAALDYTYNFLTRIQVPPDHTAQNDQRSDLLHAIDHAYRLCNRLEHLDTAPIDFSNRTFVWALNGINAMLALAQPPDPLRLQAATVAELANHAAELDTMAHQVRNQVLKEEGFGANAGSSLRLTDAFRWLARSGHHVWRICHYSHAAQSSSPASPVVSSAPDSSPTP
ncbi:MAG: Na/Pi cotransporter family protein [Burkholderiaceae bacterium]|jgi:phosphate:Na+ symporter